MKRVFVLLGLSVALAEAHDIITTPITFNREISRLFYDRCVSCHHDGGTAFSLLTYAEARPWAVAIKEEVLTRRMPPWGAVKGFGDFRNDQALTPEQLELVTSWTDGGVPEGDEKDPLPKPRLSTAAGLEPRHGAIAAHGDFQLHRGFVLDGLVPQHVPEKANFQVTAELPDGSLVPLVWIDNYKPQFAHAFLLREPLALPAGSTLRGIPNGVTLLLLPPDSNAKPEPTPQSESGK
ncbi:MAG: hypothetical protein LAP40_10510 [Acidobacteriia bacterium]|nr:hypothetical protein [Terriglobia bacterium]